MADNVCLADEKANTLAEEKKDLLSVLNESRVMLNEAIRTIEEQKVELEAKDEEYCSLLKDIDLVQQESELKEKSEEVSQLMEENEDLQKKLQEMSLMLKDCEEKKTRLHATAKDLKVSNDKLNERLSKKYETIESLALQQQEFVSQLFSLQKTLDQSRVSEMKMQTELTSLKASKEELEKDKKDELNLKKRISVLEEQLSEAKYKLEKNKASDLSLKEEIAELKAQLDVTKRSELRAKEGLQVSAAREEGLLDQIESIRFQLEDAIKTHEDLKTKNDILKEYTSELKAKVGMKDEMNFKLQQKMLAMKEEATELDACLQIANSGRSHVEKQLTKLHEENHSLESRLDDKMLELENCKQEVDSLQDRLKLSKEYNNALLKKHSARKLKAGEDVRGKNIEIKQALQNLQLKVQSVLKTDCRQEQANVSKIDKTQSDNTLKSAKEVSKESKGHDDDLWM